MTLEEAYVEFTEEFLAQQEEEDQVAECMFLQRKLPRKQGDPGRFIGELNIGEQLENQRPQKSSLWQEIR
jgi:hypothetical protein